MRVLARSMPILFLVGALLVSLSATPVAAQPSRSQVGKAVQEAMNYARTLPDAFGGLWLTDEGAVFAFTHRATDEQIADVLVGIRPGIPVTTVRVDWSEAEIDATQDAITDYVQTLGRPYVVMGVGTDIPRHEAELAPLTPEGRRVILLPAELTLRELEAIQELVSADLPELLAMGMQIEEVGVDPERNAVVVGLREDSPGALLILQQRYGPHVITEGVGAT